MRTLAPGEIRLLVQTLHHLEGARLQAVYSTSKDLVFEFWKQGDLYFLWYEDSNLRPFISFWPYKLPLRFKKTQTPIGLFLKAHFVGKPLSSVAFYPEYGRMFRLYFHKDYSIEFRLFPHGPNIIAKADDKQISLHKPKLLQKIEKEFEEDELRSVEEFSAEWLQFHSKLKMKESSSRAISTLVSPSIDPLEKELDKKKKKLRKAIQQVSEELKKKENSLFHEVGEWLSQNRSFANLPSHYTPFVDQRRSIHWNVDQCFQKSKDLRRKQVGTEARLQQLQKELSELEEKGVSALQSNTKKAPERLRPKDEIKARSYQVSPDLKAVAGKSAKDNLALLRRAQSWDLWFHLRDFPSSHMVVFRAKKRELTSQEEERVIQWFFKQTFGKRWEQEVGNKVDVIVAECRYVKPIKGDKPGRVHYHNEKVLRREIKSEA